MTIFFSIFFHQKMQILHLFFAINTHTEINVFGAGIEKVLKFCIRPKSCAKIAFFLDCFTD